MRKRQPQKQKSNDLPETLKRHLKEEDIDQYAEQYHCPATRASRELLAKELSRRLENAILDSEKKDKYDLSSWIEFQADNIGYRRAVRELISLLTKE